MTTALKGLVLDLDDTLYAEISYLHSAYRFIAAQLSDAPEHLSAQMLQQYHTGENVFERLAQDYSVDKTTLLDWYRFHTPDICLYPHVLDTLKLGRRDYRYAVITDGRAQTQRNKLHALGVMPYLSSIVISEEMGSEKPAPANYETVMQALQCEHYIYVGDNLKKDFVTAKRLGWTTICLKDQGHNIHAQDFSIAEPYQADYCFNTWQDIQNFLVLDRKNIQ